MNKIMIIILGLFVASAAQAGPKPISKRMLNVVLKNHLWVADVKHPGVGIKLFDACFDGDNFVSKSDRPASRCVKTLWETDPAQAGKTHTDGLVLTPEQYHNRSALNEADYTPTCAQWETYNPVASNTRTKQEAYNCRWVDGKDHPNQGLYGDKPFERVTLCDYRTVPSSFPLTQVIEVYQLMDNTSGNRVYFHSSHADRVVPGYQRYTYTIPYCQDLPGRDRPDTKK